MTYDANWHRSPGSTLDRSASQRTPDRTPSPYKSLARSESHRVSGTPATGNAVPPSQITLKPARPAPPRPPPGVAPKGEPARPTPAVVPPVEALSQPRRREQPKPTISDAEVVERLKTICTDADPTKLYRSLVKIGQGCVVQPQLAMPC
jgi:p21-activated kinase 1